eukprot:1726952-Alexandrium_andersonii.AAC.1
MSTQLVVLVLPSGHYRAAFLNAQQIQKLYRHQGTTGQEMQNMPRAAGFESSPSVSYTHLRAHETSAHL